MGNDISQSGFLDFSIFPLQEPAAIIKMGKGSNQKKLLVVLEETDANPERLEFLKKILAAAKFEMEKDIFLLPLNAKTIFSFVALRKMAAELPIGNFENMLVFGFPPSHFGLQLDVQKYQPFNFYESGFLFADALSVLEKETKFKGALWKGMQELFALEK